MALRVLLSEEGHFDGLEDEDGNMVAFHPIEGGRRWRKKQAGDTERYEMEEEDDEEDTDSDLWYPDEEAPVEMFATELVCDFCGAEEPKQLCGECRKLAYCGDECARQDWDQLHKHECSAPVDEKIAVQLIEALTINENEGIGAHPSDEEYAAFLVEERSGRRGGGRSGPPRSRSLPARSTRRTAPARVPSRGRSTPRMRRTPYSPFATSRSRRYARPPPGSGSRFGRWRGSYGRRRWYRPGLYPWFTSWYPGYAYNFATRALAPFLYWPRGRRYDPEWYFDPYDEPSRINRQLDMLRMRYAMQIARGYDIVPDFNRGRFRWVRRRF